MSNLPRGERGPTGDHGQGGDTGPTGPTGAQGPRGRSFLEFSKWQLIAFLVVLAAAAWGNYQAYDIGSDNETILDGILLNRDFNCRAAETKHAEEIADLKDTYEVLKDPPKVYEELLANPVILADFRETVLAAANDEDATGEFVSPLCDEPGYGLKEPDPVNPSVPDYIEELLPGITEQVAKAETNGVVEDEAKANSKP